MLLVLSEEHKTHLGFLTQVDVEGLHNARNLGCYMMTYFPQNLHSGKGVLQDITGVH